VTGDARAHGAGRRLGDYEILAVLEQGGMGEVLLARKLGAGGFEKLVAVKTMRTELSDAESARKMFFDEAQLLARLDHPAIAQVYDFGETDGRLYLVMEYVEGVRFRALRERRPPPAIAARAMAEVCRGLHAAHELCDLGGRPMHVVHRDITPENLMLTFTGRVKVLDFGIALVRGRQAPVTEIGTIKGKPPYLSPEQLKGQAVDRRTDVFSAAIVLYELLTGEPLFLRDSVYAVARAIEHEDVSPPSALVGPLPAGLDECALAGLARDPDQRFATALALAAALDAVSARAGGESLEAYARRELAGQAERHRAFLRDPLGAAATGESRMLCQSQPARPTGVMTAQAPAPAPTGVTPAAALPTGVAPLAPTVSAASPAAPAGLSPAGLGVPGPAPVQARLARDDETEPVFLADGALARGRRRGAWLALVLGLVGAGALFWATRDDSRARSATPALAGAPAATAHAPSRADANVIAVTPAAIDAGPPRTPGAEPAREPTRQGARPTRREPRNASEPTPATDPAPGPARATDPVAPRTAPAGADRAPPPTAYITIAATPFALVRIDGKEIGTTPILRRAIASGRHEVVLVTPDTGTIRLRRALDLAPDSHERIVLE
jgi:serine/threonine-protein kinase